MAVDEKIKKLLLALNNQINSDALNAALSADAFISGGTLELNDEDIEDVLTQAKGLLTIDSAKSNRDIIDDLSKSIKDQAKDEAYNDIKQKVLFANERGLVDLANKVGVEFTVKPGDENASKIMMEQLLKADIGGNNDEQLKSLVTKLKEDNERLNGEIVSTREGHQEEIKKIESDYARKELRNKFYLTANSYKWGDTLLGH